MLRTGSSSAHTISGVLSAESRVIRRSLEDATEEEWPLADGGPTSVLAVVCQRQDCIGRARTELTKAGRLERRRGVSIGGYQRVSDKIRVWSIEKCISRWGRKAKLEVVYRK
jgi:hypothetical protein